MIEKLFRGFLKTGLGFIQNVYLYPAKHSITKSNLPLRNSNFGKNIFIAENVTLKPFNTNSMLEIGNNVNISEGCIIHTNSIGRYTYISQQSRIYANEIGAFCSLGARIGINQRPHPLNFVSTHGLFHKKNYGVVKEDLIPFENVTIGNDVWIGYGAYIMGGVSIGTGSVIGTGAVVTKDIPPYAIAYGIPAEIKKYRFDEATREKLLESKWWKWSEEKLKEKALFSNNINVFLKN